MSHDVEVYLGNEKRWVRASDYQKAAYLDYKTLTPETDQMYYVDNGFVLNQCVKKTYPGIKKIEKNVDGQRKSEPSSGNIIFRMKREILNRHGGLSPVVFYIITDDGRKIPISDRPELKKLHQAEEEAKTFPFNEI